MIFRVPTFAEIVPIIIMTVFCFGSSLITTRIAGPKWDPSKFWSSFKGELTVIALLVLGIFTNIDFIVWAFIFLIVFIVLPAFVGAWREVHKSHVAENPAVEPEENLSRSE